MKEISSGCIAYRKNGKIYLLMILDRFGYWTFPKGKVEDDESLEKTAVREVKEETGIDVEIERYLGETHYRYTHSERGNIDKTVYWFLAKAVSFDIFPAYGEITRAEWIELESAKKLCGYKTDSEILEKLKI
ncbi:MAG: NUDIX domain-containing protein [bacterium]|nr:NUDIX domain-containing protein [bacterium]